MAIAYGIRHSALIFAALILTALPAGGSYSQYARARHDHFADLQICFGTTVPACLDVHDFDVDGQSNGVINIDDFDGFTRCFNGPDFAPQPGCEVAPAKARGTPPETGMFTLHGRPIDVLPDGKVLMDFRTRIYDPQHGRWLQRDRAGYADSQSLYEAFRTNAATRTDPSGMGDVVEEGFDLAYQSSGFAWTFARGISPKYVLIDHPEWPFAFIMDRQAAKDEFDDFWFWEAEFTPPFEIMQHATSLLTRSGTRSKFLAVLDKRAGSSAWLEPDAALVGDRSEVLHTLAQGGLLRTMAGMQSLTAAAYTVVTGALAAPAGAGAAAVDVGAATLDLTSGQISAGQGAVVLGVTIGGALLHLKFADDVLPLGGARAFGREGTGAYADVGGHHVHMKAAFSSHVAYDPAGGFAISQDFMRSRGWAYQLMTSKQRELFAELARSGRPNTMREHSRIAVEALIAGGATREEARALVAESLRNLRAQGVRVPTDIPWAP